jgi:hypothetical protein
MAEIASRIAGWTAVASWCPEALRILSRGLSSSGGSVAAAMESIG